MKRRRYLTRAEAAEYVGFSPQTLSNLAAKGRGPRFSKPSAPGRGAKTLYDIADLDRWLSGGRVAPNQNTAQS